MATIKIFRNKNGKLVNSIKISHSKKAPAAAVKKPDPARSHTTTIINSKGKKVSCIKIVSSKLTPKGERQQLARLKNIIVGFIAQAERSVLNRRS